MLHAEVGMFSELLYSDATQLALWFAPLFAAPFLTATLCALAGLESLLLLPGFMGAVVWLALHLARSFIDVFGPSFVTHVFVLYGADGYFAGLILLILWVVMVRTGAADRVAISLDRFRAYFSVQPTDTKRLRRAGVNAYGWSTHRNELKKPSASGLLPR